MNRLIRIISAFLCSVFLLSSISAYAAGECISSSDVKVKTDRLFEVKIGFKSKRTITAARFTLRYNASDIVARKPVCNLSRAKVKFVDKNGTTDIIFLCSSGVKCSEFPTLFTMKYKKLTDNNTKVTISASDCVDNNLKNFTPPKSAVCNIIADAKAGSGEKSARGSGGAGGSGDSEDNGGSDNNGEDILETSGKSGDADTEDSSARDFSGDEDPIYMKLIPVFLLAIILIFLGLILRQNILLKKAEKRREEEKEQKDKKD